MCFVYKRSKKENPSKGIYFVLKDFYAQQLKLSLLRFTGCSRNLQSNMNKHKSGSECKSLHTLKVYNILRNNFCYAVIIFCFGDMKFLTLEWYAHWGRRL